MLEKILQLQELSYQLKHINNNQSDIGFVAQEVKKIFSQIVGEREDGTKLLQNSTTFIFYVAVDDKQSMGIRIIYQNNDKHEDNKNNKRIK